MKPQLISNVKISKSTLVTIILSTVILAVAVGIYLYLAPGRQIVEPFPEEDRPRVIFEGQDLATGYGEIKDGEIYVSKNFIKDHFDPYIYYEESSNHLTITTEDKFFQMQTDQLSAKVNEQDRKLKFPPKLINGEPFLPANIVEEIYPVNTTYSDDKHIIVIENLENPVLKGYAVDDDLPVRQAPGIREGIIDKLSQDQEVTIYSQEDNWYYVQTDQGYLGYIDSQNISLKDITIRETEEEKEQRLAPPARPFGEPINLTWEHVISDNPETEEITDMPGVNVISPTWFHLQNSQGDIINLADKSYVQWAHDQDMQVWGLFSNNFDADLTSEFLSDPEARQNAIDQILLHTEIYNLDGINLDFENIHLEDRDAYTQFVREISPFLREQGLVVSVDVTFISQSENWSQSYDRQALSDTVDYIMVMAYDEHWGNSPKAGSVASLPWVENNLENILEVVPNDQLVLGVPFYTRLWEEEKIEDGSISVSSSAYGMNTIENKLDEHNAEITFDEKTGQYYGEYEQGDKRYRAWLETEESMKQRVELVNEYNLAGIASWRRGFEREEIWEVIKEELNISND